MRGVPTVAMAILWFEQALADLPPADDWLSPDERSQLAGLRFPKRRSDWRLGRWTAKLAVSEYLHLPFEAGALAKIQVRATASGAPEVVLESGQPKVAISITHRAGVAACAVADSLVTLGCDIEAVEPRSPEFTRDYFTVVEQETMAGVPACEQYRLAALFWSAKESTLKAVREGLRLDTRSVAVEAQRGEADAIWHRLTCRTGIELFHGWWQSDGTLVRTLISSPASAAPSMLLLQTDTPVSECATR